MQMTRQSMMQKSKGLLAVLAIVALAGRSYMSKRDQRALPVFAF